MTVVVRHPDGVMIVEVNRVIISGNTLTLIAKDGKRDEILYEKKEDIDELMELTVNAAHTNRTFEINCLSPMPEVNKDNYEFPDFSKIPHLTGILETEDDDE